jgi:hypothetical protein
VGSAAPFLGEEGTPGRCVCGLGRQEAKAQWGGRPVAGLRRRRWPKRGGVGMGRWQVTQTGPKSLLGLKSK